MSLSFRQGQLVKEAGGAGGAGGGGTELSEATRLLSVLDRPRAPPLKWLTLPCAGWFRGVKPGHGPSGWHFC